MSSSSIIEWCGKSELDVFSKLLKQGSINSEETVAIHPVNAINDNCIEFLLNATPEYTDLARSFISVRVKITRANNDTAIGSTARVGPVNNLLHSLFSQVDVTVNNTLVSSSDNLYPYRAYFENLLSYGDEAKEEQLYFDGWTLDEAGSMDVNNPLAVPAAAVAASGSTAAVAAVLANKGLAERHARLVGKSAYYYGRLHCDIFHQSKLLLDHCALRIKLIRNKAPFILQSSEDNADYVVKIESAEFHALRIRVDPDTQRGIEMKLSTTPAQYNLNRIDMKTFALPTRTTTFNQTIFNGKLPTRLILGLVSNSALTGSYKENPFNFQHFGLQSLALAVNGSIKQAHMFNNLDFANGNVGLAYKSLSDALGKSFKNTGIGIKPQDYHRGYTIFAFDLTPDDASGHSGESEDGDIRVDIRLAAPLETAATLVCYSESDCIFAIDKYRNCTRLL